MKTIRLCRSAAAMASAAFLGILLPVTAAVPAHVVHADGWQLVWHDEFGGNTAGRPAGTGVDTSEWKYDIGQGVWGTGEIETMTNSTANVYQQNGDLVIKALRDDSRASQPDKGWTSGRIETVREDFGAPPGGEVAFEARIQDPNLTGDAAAGYWPAFWMLGTPFRHGVSWPTSGEIDAMENVDGINRVWGTLHCGVLTGSYPFGPCHEYNGLGGSTPCPQTTCQADFHTYRVEVDRRSSPEEIRWYVDGQEYWTVKSTDVDSAQYPHAWEDAVDHPFFIIFDLAMGGAFPEAFYKGNGSTPAATTQSGGAMLVDYVRVYNLAPSGPPSTTPTPELGSAELLATGLVPLVILVLWRRRSADRRAS